MVQVYLVTHESGGITERDLALAKAMDALVRRETGQALGRRQQVGQVDDGIFVHGYHSSIWSNGLAGGWLPVGESTRSVSGRAGLPGGADALR